jgi:hypothetical protein
MKYSLITASCLIGVLATVHADETERNADEKFGECGAISTYFLLEVCGVNTEYQRVAATLPVPTKDGYSLAEIQAASRILGLRSGGFKLAPGTRQLDRPMIAMMRNGEDGHYIVLKPVKAGSSLVQVLDPPFEPKIIPLDELIANPNWTGLTLQPMTFLEDIMARGKPAWVMLGIFSVALLGYKTVRMQRRAVSSSTVEMAPLKS